MGFAENKCVPCRGDVPPMERATAEEMLKQLETKKGSCAAPFQIAQLFRAIAEAERVHATRHLSLVKDILVKNTDTNLEKSFQREKSISEMDKKSRV